MRRRKIKKTTTQKRKHKNLVSAQNLSASTIFFESHFLPAKKRSKYLTIVLHGRGDTLSPFKNFHEEMRLPHMNYLLLNAPRKFLKGRSWYAEPPQQRLSLEKLRHTFFKMLSELESQGWEMSKLFLLGFSQGGLVAADVALHFPLKFAGVIGISSYFHFTPRWKNQITAMAKKTPWIFTHGTKDDILLWKTTEYGVYKLRQAGLKIDWVVTDKKHVFDDADYSVVRAWMMKQL